jgi:phosphate-selective porin OprO/OprP
LAAVLLAVAMDTRAGFDPELQSGPWAFGLGGRFMFDFLLDSSAPPEDQQHAEVRRARLKLKVDYGDNWSLTGSVDFPDAVSGRDRSPRSISTRDLALSFSGWPVHLTVGRMQEPFSMIAIESSKYLGLMERPLASGLGVGYGLGIRANLRGERWALTTGACAPVTDVLDLADDSDDDALDLRFTSTPLRAELAFIHIGVSASWRWPEADTLRFSLRPETTLVQDLDINHPRLRDVSRYRLTGLEFAWRAESLLLQSEYFRADIQRADHRDPTFAGYYVQLSWALTGERRGYSTRWGVFGGVEPARSLFDGGPGAIELALRYGEADLRDAGIEGDTGVALAGGLNWYPTDNLRASVNYVRITEDEIDRRNREDLWQARLQFHF